MIEQGWTELHLDPETRAEATLGRAKVEYQIIDGVLFYRVTPPTA